MGINVQHKKKLGEMIRITQNGFTKDKRRLNNGDLRQVKGFTKDGDIKLGNG